MGKQLKIILFFLSCILIYNGLNINVYADDYNASKFKVDNISIDDINESFINTLTISANEMRNQNIRNFDVDKEGNIIICLSNNSINVYNNSLEFLYNIDFDVNGSSIAFWYNNTVAVYLDKDSMFICVDKNGNIINACQVKNTVENSRLYRQISGNKKLVDNNYSYELCYSSFLQKILIFNPTKMIRVNKENQEIIYENHKATSDALVKFIMIVLFVLIFLLIFKSVKKNMIRANIKENVK